jgi:RNA polymerase sigma-70 factor (ECF subfamily)
MSSVDLTILEQASQGDLGAFEQVYRMTSGFVYNVALRITQNTADAEEVVQDVFMSVYRNLKNFKFRSNFKTWVYRITVNTAINRYRKFGKEQKNRVDFEKAIQSLPSESLTAEKAMQGDRESRLHRLLGSLSPEHKSCLILREIEGLSYQEMASALNIPVNTVRSRLKRARQTLLENARKEAMSDEL